MNHAIVVSPSSDFFRLTLVSLNILRTLQMHMQICYLLAADDADLDKLDYAAMSPQEMLEIAIEAIGARTIFQDKNENYKKLKNWKGVKLNKEGKVEKIEWSKDKEPFFKGGGSIAMDWIPDTTREVNIGSNGLKGQVDFRKLPTQLKHLNVRRNKFTGNAELDDLPHHLKSLDMSNNDFSGSVDLAHLPETLQKLDLSSNIFEDGVVLILLPKNLKELDLSCNRFDGSVDLCKLPPALKELDLRSNQFSGKLDIRSLPASLEKVNLKGNQFERALDATELDVDVTMRLEARAGKFDCIIKM